MLTKVFGLTCPSLCSSQQSGDRSALCSPFLLLLPQKSPGPYPQMSKRWIQPGVHPLSHQGRIKFLSCLAARLVPPLAGAEGQWGNAQWALILQGGQECSFLGLGLLLTRALEPLDTKSCSERLVPSAFAAPGQGTLL